MVMCHRSCNHLNVRGEKIALLEVTLSLYSAPRVSWPSRLLVDVRMCIRVPSSMYQLFMSAAIEPSGDVKAAQGMHPGGWSATLAVLGVLVAAAAPHGDSGTSDDLHQALVLIDILRSGMARRKTTTSPAAPAPAALPASLAPWLGPHGAYVAPYYPYEEPLRRFYGGMRGGRQLQYDDTFGAHPGDQPDVNDAVTSAPVNSKAPEDQLSSTSRSAASEHSAVDASAVDAPATAGPIATTAAPRHALTPTDIVTSTPRALHHPEPPSSSPAATKIKKLNYIKEDKYPTRVSNEDRKKIRQSDEHIEVSQAAAELQLEATAGGAHPPWRHRGTTRERLAHQPWRHRGTTRERLARPPWQPRGSTRVHLGRSSALPRPLPENNAFCHASPRSPLCRTFI